MADKKIGDLKFGVVVDGQEFIKGTKQLQVKAKELDSSVQSATKGIDGMGKSAKNASGNFLSFGNVLKFIGFGALIAGVKNFVGSLFKLGSDLEETQSKFNVVFSGIEDKARQTFDSMAEANNRSILAIEGTAATLGNIIKPLGFTTEEALRLSSAYTQLAIDLASFNNVSDDQAALAIRGALTGEYEALKSLGIVLNDNIVKQTAYNLGIAKTGAELTQQQKALAATAVLTKNTSDAQGDAIRTSASFANQMKGLGAVIQNTMAQAGHAVANETAGLLGTIGDFIKKYGVSIVQSIVATGKSVFKALGAMYNAVNTIAKAIASIFKVMFQTNDKNAQTSTQNQLNLFQYFAIGLQSIAAAISIIFNGIATAISVVGNFVQGIFRGMANAGADAVDLIAAGFKGMANAVGGIFSAIGTRIINGLKGIANSGIDILNGLISAANKLPGVDIGTVGKLNIAPVQSFGSIVSDSFKATRAAASDFAKSFNEGASADFKQIGDAIKDFKFNASEAIGSVEDSYVDMTTTIGEESDYQRESLEGLSDLYPKYADEAAKAGKAAGGAGGKAADAAKEAQQAEKERFDALQKLGEEAVKQVERNEQAKVNAVKDRAIKEGLSEEALAAEISKIQEETLKEKYKAIQDELARLEDAYNQKEIGEELYLAYKADINDALAKLSEQLADKQIETQKEVDAATKESIDKLSAEYDKYQDALKETEEKTKELAEKTQEYFKDIQDGIKDTTKEMNNLSESFQADVAQQVVDAQSKIADIQKDITAELLKKQDIQNQIASADQNDVSKLQEDLAKQEEVIKGKELELKKQQELIASANELKEQGLLSQEAIDEAQRKSTLNSIQLKTEEFLAEKAILEERQAILQSFNEGQAVDLSTIKDEKNLQLAEELTAKKEQLDQELALVQQQQQDIQNAWIQGAAAIEAVNDQLIKRLDEKYKALAARIKAALDAARSASSSGGIAPAAAQIGGQFQEGGFTGDGPSNRAVGVVHAGEFVASARLVNANRSLFAQLDRLQRKGYQEGGMVTNNNQKSTVFNATVHHQVGLASVLKQARKSLR